MPTPVTRGHSLKVGDFIEAMENSQWDTNVRKGWRGYVARLRGMDSVEVESSELYGRRECEAHIFKLLEESVDRTASSYNTSPYT